MSEDKTRRTFELVTDFLEVNRDFLSGKTIKFLEQLRDFVDDELEPTEESDFNGYTISVDGSITANPGGKASVGYVIRSGKRKITSAGAIVNGKTNNEAEYQAIKYALLCLRDTVTVLNDIKIYTDSRLVANQLNGVWKIENSQLKHQHSLVKEIINEFFSEITIEIIWAPRNSTPDLLTANFTAQDLLGIKRH